jgi:chemotaxis protein CheD
VIVTKAEKQHYLLVGCIFVAEESTLVTTILGSCVSVCLWDSIKKIGGINHYMLPFWNGEGLASPKYGNIAIMRMIERMMALGSSQNSLKAKIFGGGEVFRVTSAAMHIGQRNIQLARELLEEVGIPIINSDVGGPTGRKIMYDTGTGDVFVKKLAKPLDDIVTPTMKKNFSVTC